MVKQSKCISSFSLVLFSTCEQLIRRCDAAGIEAVVVDWEDEGKWQRQKGYDTQINRQDIAALKNVRRLTTTRLICRINNHDDLDRLVAEAEQAVQGGADEILLPMVRHLSQVERLLSHFQSRCGIALMLETMDAIRLAKEFGSLPLSRVYVGLNDLAIDRGSGNIFMALVDGTVDGIRQFFDMPFGMAGLTLPGRGDPIPTNLLMVELVRCNCDFTFLRRSFLRDSEGLDLADAIDMIRSAMVATAKGDREALDSAHREFVARVSRLGDFSQRRGAGAE